jgi:hypothetical protein
MVKIAVKAQLAGEENLIKEVHATCVYACIRMSNDLRCHTGVGGCRERAGVAAAHDFGAARVPRSAAKHRHGPRAAAAVGPAAVFAGAPIVSSLAVSLAGRSRSCKSGSWR